MSKAVKKVGRAVSKVVSGVVKAAEKVATSGVSVVKKIAKSKIGKVLLVAAAVYFGGAALVGGIKGAAAGTGFLSGASAGLSSAASGVAQAWTAATSGSLSGAGSALSQGFSGGLAPGVSAAQGAAAAGGVAGGMAPGVVAPAAGAELAASQAVASAGAGAGAGAGAAGSTGLISGAWNSLGPYGKAAAVSGGMQLGGAMIAKGEADDARKQQAADEQAARDRYNTNIGTRLYGNDTGPTVYGSGANYTRPSYNTGLVGSNMGQSGMPSFADWSRQHGFSHLYQQDPMQQPAISYPVRQY